MLTNQILARACWISLVVLGVWLGSCSEPGPNFGAIRASVATTGGDVDLDGYTLLLDDSAHAIQVNAEEQFSHVATGTHTVSLGDVAQNCTVSGETSRFVTVRGGQTAEVAFAVTCSALTGVGTLEVRVATSGTELDFDGYEVYVDAWCLEWSCEYWSDWASPNDTVWFAVAPGRHSVDLESIAGNCTLANAGDAVVTPGATTRVALAVTCEPSGSMRLTTVTTGADLDPDCYTVLLDRGAWHSAYVLGTNASVTIPLLRPGEYSVDYLRGWRWEGVAPNCMVNGQYPDTVRVVVGTTIEVPFAVTCAALGSLQVTVTTTGVDLPDVHGAYVSLAGAPAGTPGRDERLSPNGSVTFPGLVAGVYSVSLGSGVFNCTSPNPQTVAVPSGGTAVVHFDVACTAVMQLAVVRSPDSIAGHEEIYLVKANGTGLVRLTTNTASDAQPAWSPDGGKIAFATTRDGNWEIYVMDAGGQNPVRLTTAPAADRSPAWSPDGSKIAFTSDRDGNAEIYVMDTDGSNPVRLTNHAAHEADPAWSPDGSKIAFASNRDGNFEIYVIDADGQNPLRLTTNTVDDVQPDWSPDGTKLVFSRFESAWCGGEFTGLCGHELFVMNADGSAASLLPIGYRQNRKDPAWSPDGAWIAFAVRVCSGDSPACQDVHYARMDGSLGLLVGNASQPAWRP
jgi:WD40-like Beta Propeller Repeat